ncbi:MAG: glycosyltransferase [Rhodospirillales bacterium]|nr:glycosyltransferase [Rhodospirillales bacterium]
MVSTKVKAGATRAPANGQAKLLQHKNILVVADMLPLFDQPGGSSRLKTMLDMLGSAGWNIIFGSFAELDGQPGLFAAPEGRTRCEKILQDIGVTHILYGPGQIEQYLAKRGQNLNWVFLSFSKIATALMPLVRSHCPAARVAYDMVDFRDLQMMREAEMRGDETLRAGAERKHAEELACARVADVTLVVTMEEKAALLGGLPEAAVEVLPNVCEIPQQPPEPRGRKNMLFVGDFRHMPNGNAVHWFAEKILPLIRREYPEIVFRIAGADPGNDILALAALPGVEVLGSVPDPAPLYRQHRISVAPFRYGAGMKNKIEQSLAFGLPVVATFIGTEGMGLKDGQHLLIGKDEEAFASHIINLLQDDALWTNLSAAGRAHIEQSLSATAVRGRWESILGG